MVLPDPAGRVTTISVRLHTAPTLLIAVFEPSRLINSRPVTEHDSAGTCLASRTLQLAVVLLEELGHAQIGQCSGVTWEYDVPEAVRRCGQARMEADCHGEVAGR
jgi:hypothetical protein